MFAALLHASANSVTFDRVLELRREIAALLKYNTWADYITEIKMVKSGDNVEKASSTTYF